MNTLTLDKAHNDNPTVSMNLTKVQLAKSLKKLANHSYKIMLKTRFIGTAVKVPLKNIEHYSTSILESLHQYTTQLTLLGDDTLSITDLGTEQEHVSSAIDWRHPVKELVGLHAEIKKEILNVFIHFKEADFPEAFAFLRTQLFLHEEQLWEFKTQLNN